MTSSDSSPKSKRFYAVVQYEGTRYAGWQRQQKDDTVQGAIETGLASLCGRPVTVHAAGRTDAGVHALGQVISFEMPTPWCADDLQRAANVRTPHDIWFAHLETAPLGFHARKSATSRLYHYKIGCDGHSRSPFRHRYEWALGEPLDHDVLQQAADVFLGEHDFRGFSRSGPAKPHYRCVILRATWQKRSDAEGFIFVVEANRFLHRMVRFLVGAMVEVAQHRRETTDLQTILEHGNNQEASPPAPPQGLYFVRATYPQLDTGSHS